MWDENKIRDYMLEITNKMTARDKEIVLKYVETLPIKIDGRLKKNMAYVSMSIDIETKEVINAVQFKFSKRLFYYNDDEIKHVIGHELMHLLVNLKYKKDMEHNKIWKIYCNKYGIPDNQYFENDIDIEKDAYRYHVYCKLCGKYLGGYSRLSQNQVMKLIYMSKHGTDDGNIRIYDNKLGKDVEFKFSLELVENN